MLGSVIVGHFVLWVISRCLKNNNKVILKYDKEIALLEDKLQECTNTKEINLI